jgi:ArsR family transcriptional regulator
MSNSDSATRIDMMFRAFSDRTRLRILHLLVNGELCVGELVSILELPQPRVSRHLAYLRKAGLVDVRKSGVWKYYSLAAADSPFHEKIVSCMKDCFNEVPELQADDARAAKVQAAGNCCPDKSCQGKRCA